MRCPSIFQSEVEGGMYDVWRTSPDDYLSDLYATSTLYPSLRASLLTMHSLAPYDTLGLDSSTRGYAKVPLTMHLGRFMMERG